MLRIRTFLLVCLGLLALSGPEPVFAQGVVTTIAGTDWLFSADGQPAVNAPLSASAGPDLAFDAQGNLYICDLGNAMILRISPAGIITVIAGTGLVADSGNGGPALNASLLIPMAVAVDRTGAGYVADGTTIRKIFPNGIIRTIAGLISESAFSGDGGPALNARFGTPSGLVVGPDGSIYIADNGNVRIRKITPDGNVRTIAGSGVPGFSGDGGPALSARLLGPGRITLDSRGNIFFVDASTDFGLRGVIRKIDTNGVITTVAGGGTRTGDNIPATQSSLVALAVAVDSSGNIFLADRVGSTVRRVDAVSGLLTTVAGDGTAGFAGDGGSALRARFSFNASPALAVDATGNIFVGDEGNGRVRKIDRAGIVTTFAGNGLFRFSGNGGPATSATLYLPTALAQDGAGNTFVSERTYGRIRRIAPDGTISVYAGNGTSGYSGDGGPATRASLNQPLGISVGPDGAMIFADSANCVLRRIETSGNISTIAGTGVCGTAGDGGPATRAQLFGPAGVYVDGAGNIAFTENEGNRIRLVVGGQVLTIAGNGSAGYSGDGGDSLNAKLSAPAGITLNGNYIYFADSDNNVIRRILLDSTRKIETVVGTGVAGFAGDGGPARSAQIDSPVGITFDPDGNMYIADSGNVRIRKVGRDGVISSVAGGGQYRLDGVPGDFALVTPYDVLVDRDRNILFTDIFFNRVRAVLSTVPSFTGAPLALTLSAPAGGQATEQILQLTGSIAGVIFATGADVPWLNVTPEYGAMPAVVTVKGDASTLAPGTYRGNVNVLAVATPFTLTVPVTFNVTAAGQPSLGLSSSTLSFSFVRGVAGTKTRPINVSNAGGGTLAFTVRTSITAGQNWLQVSTTGGTLAAFAATAVNFTANPAGLAAGTYSAVVTVSNDALGQRILVPVTMTVSAVQQTILIPQTGLSFFATQGNGSGSVLPQFFSILNTGQGQMQWTTTPTTRTGAFWLGAFPSSGVTDAAQPIVPRIRVDVDPTELAAGVYYGSVQVIAPNADNSPQSVSIVLTVVPRGATIGPIVQPSGLVFIGAAGGGDPGAQTIQLQSTRGSELAFRSGAVTLKNNTLFDILPASGTIPAAQPLRVLIQPKTAGLAAGVYRGTLTMSFADGTTRNITLALVLAPPGTPVNTPAPFESALETVGLESVGLENAAPRTAGSCVPKTLVPVFTDIAEGFSIPASYPGQVGVKVVDDCSTPMVDGGVTVSFSNGDPPLRLTSLKDGTWAGTWTPQRSLASISVTAAANLPEQNLKGQVSVKGGLGTGNTPPVLAAGGIVNSASNSGQAVAPGSLVSLYGARLADGVVVAPGYPLPNALGNVSVLIAGREAPLLFTSDGQINAMIPYGIASNTTHQILSTRGSTLSTPQSVVIAPAVPGIFTRDGKQGIIVDQQNRDANPSNPVRAGDAVVIYCTGLGEVNPSLTAGTAASLTVLSRTVNPVSVTIGGQNATVLFSGLTPGFVGLYQVNAIVPTGVTPGSAVEVTLTSAGQTSAPATIAVR